MTLDRPRQADPGEYLIGIRIYAMICPICNECRWVGKSTDRLNRRLSKHLRHSTGHYNPPKREWMEHLRERGLKPIIVELEFLCPWGDWVAAETWWIEYMKWLGAKLYNRRKPC